MPSIVCCERQTGGSRSSQREPVTQVHCVVSSQMELSKGENNLKNAQIGKSSGKLPAPYFILTSISVLPQLFLVEAF